jgi:transposase
MGRTLEIKWQETASELKDQYCKERNSERKMCLHAFWQLQLGKTMKEVAKFVGIGYRTLQDWVAWYRSGGLKEVLRRIKGHGNQDRLAKLSIIQ